MSTADTRLHTGRGELHLQLSQKRSQQHIQQDLVGEYLSLQILFEGRTDFEVIR